MSSGIAEIILASGSPTRKKLLANAGIDVRIVPHNVDERVAAQKPTGGRALARRLAISKAENASVKHADAFVIGADQTLELDGRVFGKPSGRDDAHAQLRALSGRRHFLYSAFAIVRNGVRLSGQVSSASLTMRDLGDDEISRYLEEMGPLAMTSVGAYQLEGVGVRLLSRVNGDYFTILGLPMLPLLASLRRLEVISL
jgi:septum formation protein